MQQTAATHGDAAMAFPPPPWPAAGPTPAHPHARRHSHFAAIVT